MIMMSYLRRGWFIQKEIQRPPFNEDWRWTNGSEALVPKTNDDDDVDAADDRPLWKPDAMVFLWKWPQEQAASAKQNIHRAPKPYPTYQRPCHPSLPKPDVPDVKTVACKAAAEPKPYPSEPKLLPERTPAALSCALMHASQQHWGISDKTSSFSTWALGNKHKEREGGSVQHAMSNKQFVQQASEIATLW